MPNTTKGRLKRAVAGQLQRLVRRHTAKSAFRVQSVLVLWVRETPADKLRYAYLLADSFGSSARNSETSFLSRGSVLLASM